MIGHEMSLSRSRNNRGGSKFRRQHTKGGKLDESGREMHGVKVVFRLHRSFPGVVRSGENELDQDGKNNDCVKQDDTKKLAS
jgi:hypothetical protein